MYIGDDSYFLEEVLKSYLKKQNKKIRILDTKKIPRKNFKGFRNNVSDSAQESKIPDMAQEPLRILDMGAGTGIHSELAKSLSFTNLTAADIDKKVTDNLKKKGFNIINSDLFKNIIGKFDLIWFNPPYLPNDKFDKQRDTSGGKIGDETIIKFLKQAKSHLNVNGKIILLLSSFTPRNKIDKIIKQHYKKKKLAEKSFFFEKLEILELKRN